MSLHIDPVFAHTDITAAGTDDLSGLDDWREMDAKQQPTYLDPAALDDSLTRLRSYPPLIFAGEADVLKQRIAAASRVRAGE